MTRRDVAVAAVWAAGSFSLALAGAWPGLLEATDQPQKTVARVERPELVVDGCKVSVLLDEQRLAAMEAGRFAYGPGEKPAFRVVATNTTGEAKTIRVSLTMLAVRPVSPMARMMPSPKSIWNDTCNIALSPNESKTVTVEPGVVLPAGRITVQASDGAGQRPIVALAFATATEAAELQLRNLNARGGLQTAIRQAQAMEVQQ